jgi:hypothetical protein
MAFGTTQEIAPAQLSHSTASALALVLTDLCGQQFADWVHL